MSNRTVQILTFEGCPNKDGAIELVTRVLDLTGVAADVEIIDVADSEQAELLHFLGSPTVRVDGRDIEPGAGDRRDFVYACRVYRTEAGLQGKPDARWLIAALT